MKKMVVILAILVFLASLAYAAECKVSENLKSDDMTKVYGARLVNGIGNVAFGWTEIFFRPGKVVAEGGNPVVGFFRGLGNAVTRTVLGASQVATFWIPGKAVAEIEDCPLCAYK